MQVMRNKAQEKLTNFKTFGIVLLQFTFQKLSILLNTPYFYFYCECTEFWAKTDSFPLSGRKACMALDPRICTLCF